MSANHLDGHRALKMMDRIESLLKSRKIASATEIADDIGIARVTAGSYLRVMWEDGRVVRNKKDGHTILWSLGCDAAAVQNSQVKVAIRKPGNWPRGQFKRCEFEAMFFGSSA